MAKSYNKIVITGHAGRDAEVRQTNSGGTVTNVSVATNDGWGDNERTNWHRVVAFGKVGEIMGQYVKKGDRLLIEGRMEYGSYERDGVTIPTAEIIASEVVFMGGDQNQAEEPVTPITRPDDDLPF